MTNPLIQTQSTYPMSAVRQRIDWNAIWGGVFMVAGIWAVFESLALAILAGTANAASGMGFGMAIWTIVLTIIAMYVAGRETSRLAGVVTRHNRRDSCSGRVTVAETEAPAG